MISKRILNKWRSEALSFTYYVEEDKQKIKAENFDSQLLYLYNTVKEMNSKILKMTQELLDQHLLKEKR